MGLREAITSVQALINSHGDLVKTYDEIKLKISHIEQKHVSFPAAPIASDSAVKVPDYVQCYTDQEPRALVDNTISGLIVGGTLHKFTYIIWCLNILYMCIL